MVLGEAHLRNILRPPPVDPTNLPPNPPHPFQKSFSFYLRQRFLKHHFPLVFGYGVAIYLFMGIDSARNNAQQASYEKAISEGHSPCECCRCFCWNAVQTQHTLASAQGSMHAGSMELHEVIGM
jgi:hypothetical protein